MVVPRDKVHTVEGIACPQNEHMVRWDQVPELGRAFQDTSGAGRHTLEAADTSPLDGGVGVVDLDGTEKLLEEGLGPGPVLEVAELVVEKVQPL